MQKIADLKHIRQQKARRNTLISKKSRKNCLCELLEHIEALDEELEKALNEKKTRGRRR